MADEEKEMFKKEILMFIEDYRGFPQLWDTTNKYYNNKVKRNDCLKVLAAKYHMDVNGVKKKIKSLRSYLAKEHNKVMRGGDGSDDEIAYRSPWFAYKHLSFVFDSNAPRESEDTFTEESNIEINETYTEEIKNEQAETSLSTFYLSEEDDQELTPPPIRKKRITSKEGEPHSIKDAREDFVKNKKPSEDSLMKPSEGDECTIYGQLIAHKIRNLTSYNRLLAQQRINSVLFDLEMKQLSPTEIPNDTGIAEYVVYNNK